MSDLDQAQAAFDMGALVAGLTRENSELKAALMSCRTSYVGYAITSNDQYAQVIDNFWRELQRIDKAARTALKESCNAQA